MLLLKIQDQIGKWDLPSNLNSVHENWFNTTEVDDWDRTLSLY